MKTRFSINERGELVRRDGTVAGRVVSITLDMDAGEGGQGGGASGQAEGSPPESPTAGGGGAGGGQLFDAPDQTKLVWEHYQATVAGAKRRKLDSTRKACIKRALTVRSLDECREAIDGLARSPHHNGQNDSKQTYLDIQYALGQKSDSPDERIDKAIGWARKYSGAVQAVTNLSDGVATLRDVISAVPSQNPLLRDVVRTRLDTAVRQFERDGIIADGVLWELREHVPNVEPVIEDAKLIGWRKVTA